MSTIAWLLAVGSLGSSGEPQEGDWDWLARHRFAAFESLMPVAAEPQTLVTYFRYRDLYQDVEEAYFTIRTKDATSLPEAIVIAPVERSIQQQLLELHMADRALPFEAALARVKVRRQRLSSGTCEEIGVALDTLRQLRFGVPQRDVIVLHPTVHRVILRFGGGDVDVSLSEDEHPLAQWAARTFAQLRSCRSGG